MTLNVTSWFIEQTYKRISSPVRKLYIDTASDTADLSNHVLKWPTIKHKTRMLRPNNISIRLANTDGSLNFLHNDPLIMRKDGYLKLGYTHPDSGDELVDIFAGEINRVALKHGEVTVYFTDIWDELTRKIVGTEEVPLDWTGSNYNPADMIWWLCTSYGGLSDIESTSNPNVDWSAFEEFKTDMTDNNIVMQGYVKDQKASECIKRIALQLNTDIFVDETNKLTFKRFTLAETNVTSLSGENVITCNIEVDEEDMINRQYINAGYDITSGSFGIVVEDSSESSINSYGLAEQIHKDETFWHVDSSSALSYAQRQIRLKGEPYTKIDIETTLVPITRTIGETIYVNNPLFEVEGGYRMLEKVIELESGKMQVIGDRTTFADVFTLDYSSLDSVYVLT